MINKRSRLLQAVMLLGLCALHTSVKAQQENTNPFAGEKDVTEKLFNLKEQDINYRFTVALEQGNFLIVEWPHLSDWHDKGDLQHIVSLAKFYYRQVADSFKYGTTAKRIDIHIPIDNEPVTMMLCEHKAERNVLLLKGSMQAPLKVNMDTIRILKTLAEKEVNQEKKLVQVQYTFLLKDLEEINKLDENNLVADAGNKFDSIVSRHRHKWTNNLTVNYYPLAENPKKNLAITKMEPFEIDGEMGVELFRDAPCPLIDIGASYKWLTRNFPSPYAYIRLSGTGFSDFQQQGATSLAIYPIEFVNIELGWFGGTLKRPRVPIHGLSFGVGYGFNGGSQNGKEYVADPSLPANMYRMFFSYTLSKLFKVNMELYSLRSEYGFMGVSAVMRFL
jgi:hypothetical protein